MKYRLMAGGSILLLLGAAIVGDRLLRAPQPETPSAAPKWESPAGEMPPVIEMPTHREQLPHHTNPANENASEKSGSIARRGNSQAMTADVRKFK